MILVDDRNINHGEKVFVYFNLRKGCFSVRAVEGKYKGLVVAHSDKIVLSGEVTEFVVSEKRRQVVLKKQQKNVHAGVRGRIDFSKDEYTIQEEIKYNPYKYESFIIARTNEPIKKAKHVLLENKKVYLIKKDY